MRLASICICEEGGGEQGLRFLIGGINSFKREKKKMKMSGPSGKLKVWRGGGVERGWLRCIVRID